MLLEVSGGELTGVLPQRGHPVSRGSLCVKGWTSWEFVASPRRLSGAFVRNGEALEAAVLEDAISLVASRLAGTVKEHGPDSVAFISSAKCTNEENYLVGKFARAVVGTNNVDHCARL